LSPCFGRLHAYLAGGPRTEAALFFAPRTDLQFIANHWHDGRPRQSVCARPGQLEARQQHGAIDGLLRSGSRFVDKLLVLRAHERGELPTLRT
jgi:hypothetical protein